MINLLGIGIYLIIGVVIVAILIGIQMKSSMDLYPFVKVKIDIGKICLGVVFWPILAFVYIFSLLFCLVLVLIEDRKK